MSTSRKSGTPVFITQPKRLEAYLEALRMGAPEKFARDLAMFTPQQFREWRDKGAEDEEAGLTEAESPYVMFLNRERLAVAECMKVNLSVLKQAGARGTWQASAWILERRFPNEFGYKQSLNSQESQKITFVNDVKPGIPLVPSLAKEMQEREGGEERQSAIDSEPAEEGNGE